MGEENSEPLKYRYEKHLGWLPYDQPLTEDQKFRQTWYTEHPWLMKAVDFLVRNYNSK